MELKTILGALDFQNKDFYSELAPEEKKKVSPWVLMRYMSSSTNYPEHNLMMTNELVNTNFTELYKHPELQWKLLCMCGSNTKTFHPWIPPPGKNKNKDKITEAFSAIFPSYKDDEIKLLIEINTKDDLIEMLESSGMQDKDIKDLVE